MTQQDAQATPDVVTGTLTIFYQDAFVLMDLGATHSFVSRNFAAQSGLQPMPLEVKLEVFTPAGLSLWPTQFLEGCYFCIGGLVMQVDLILIDLQGLDIIFGMDFLAKHHASIDCFRKEVTFKMPGLPEVVFQGDYISS